MSELLDKHCQVYVCKYSSGSRKPTLWNEDGEGREENNTCTELLYWKEWLYKAFAEKWLWRH